MPVQHSGRSALRPHPCSLEPGTEISHASQTVDERFGERTRVGVRPRAKRRHADDHVVGMRVVADSVAVLHHRPVTHESVHRRRHLFRPSKHVSYAADLTLLRSPRTSSRFIKRPNSFVDSGPV